MQAAQGLGLVTALLCQREYLTVCDCSGGVAEVTDDSDAVALRGGACVQGVTVLLWRRRNLLTGAAGSGE